MLLTFGICTRIHQFPGGQDGELIKKSNNVAAGLVNGKDDCAIIVSCKRNQTFNNIERIERIQSYSKSQRGFKIDN